MKSLVRVSGWCLGGSLWGFYALLQFRHFYDSSLLVPPTQRTVRSVKEMRLPRIYFCPADRGRVSNFRWRSYDCLLTYKDDHTTCPARIQGYKGRTPNEFKGHPERNGHKGGECLEFGTHMIGVRQEESAAWNEISLRAAFDPGDGPGVANALQEVELGYLPAWWEENGGSITLERFYYPLLRVPIFFMDGTGKTRDGQALASPPTGQALASPPTGVATRAFLGKEVDRGLTHGGRYWYTYGSMQLAVENATMPAQTFIGAELASLKRVGVVHIIITLEDFEEYDYQVVSAFFPFLQMIGQVAGVGALILWTLVGIPRERGHKVAAGAAGGGAGRAAAEHGHTGSSGFSARCGKDEEAAAMDEEEDDGEEGQALLGTEAPKRRHRIGDDKGAGQSLLGTEGGDGL